MGAAWEGEVLHLRVTPHAVEGAANWALIQAVANAFGVWRSAVSWSQAYGRVKSSSR
jgi:uncharacterized protein YggU (UPF0235/DUF167 family)